MDWKPSATMTATINASDGTPDFWLATNGTITPAANPDELLKAADATLVDWQHLEGSGALSTTSSSTDDAIAFTTLALPNAPGDAHRIEARLRNVRLAPETVGEAEVDVPTRHELRTGEIVVIEGRPDAIELSSDTQEHVADGVATAVLNAEIRDAFGNPVEDGTPVSWTLDSSPESFVSRATETIAGRASAAIRAPEIPSSQVVSVSARSVTASTVVAARGVAAGLESSSAVLDMELGESATMALTTDASDEAPVFWTTSNGTLSSSQTQTFGGMSAVTLSTAGGRPGTVVVTATVGGQLGFFEGRFERPSSVAVDVERRFLVADEVEDGVEQVMWADETVHPVPYFAATPVHLKGPPDAVVVVQEPGVELLEAFDFEGGTVAAATSGSRHDKETLQVAGRLGLHSLLLDGAVLDTTESHSGEASLDFDGAALATIAAAPELAFGESFRLSFFIRPGSLGEATLARQGAAWSLKLLADGRLEASLESGSGPVVVSSSEAVAPDVWSSILLERSPAGLLLVLDGDSTLVAAAGGASEAEEIVLGEGFDGHLDDLSFSDPGGRAFAVQLEGLDVTGRLRLDASGSGSFTARSTGVLVPPETSGMIAMNLSFGVEEGGGASAAPALKDAAPVTETTIFLFRKSTWVSVLDPVLAFLGGDPQTSLGVATNIAGGMLIVGDVGAVAKNLWRMGTWSEVDPNKLEIVLSLLGLLTELIPLAGEVPDAGVSTARALVATLGPTALSAVIVKRFTDLILSGKKLLRGEFNFLGYLSRNKETAEALGDVLTSEDIYEAAVRGYDDFLRVPCALAGSRFADQDEDGSLDAQKAATNCGEALIEAAKNVRKNFGGEIAPKLAAKVQKVAGGGFSQEVLDRIKDPDLVAQKMAEIFQAGLVTGTKSSGLTDTELLFSVINNAGLYGSKYGVDEFVKDLAEVASVQNFNHLLAAGLNNPRISSALGALYELQFAVKLAREGTLKFISKLFKSGEDGTDFDIIDVENVYYQLKSTLNAINGANPNVSSLREKAVKKVEVWIAKARSDGATEIVYVVPSDVESQILPEILEVFERQKNISIRVKTFDLVRD